LLLLTLSASSTGYRWTASDREQAMPPLRGLANRVDQATTNFLETFPFFAALVLIAHLANRHGALTLWGVHLYFRGRVGYLLTGMVLFLVALVS
jgi:uncharacterized MAPEG superfamily protein